MNVKRFTGRTSRDALNLVRQAFGEDAVVLSTKPCPEGVEVLAMAPDSIQQIERVAASAPTVRAAKPAAARTAAPSLPAPAKPAAPQRAAQAPAPRAAAAAGNTAVERDVEQLAMSTLSFQDYVRERMLKRRQASLREEPTLNNNADAAESQFAPESMFPADAAFAAPAPAPAAAAPVAAPAEPPVRLAAVRPLRREAPAAAAAPAAERHTPPVLRDEIRVQHNAPVPSLALHAQDSGSRREQVEMMNELRSMKGLIEERFGALAFMEKLQRHPAQARLTQKLMDTGFSPALIRKLVESLPQDVADESAWAANVLERNLTTGEHEAALEDQGGVFAMIGSTGVGKTTSTAKLAAAFAAKHGANHLGLITLDAYRVAAHEQLRTYGRILGVPVHTAHDRTSLEDLLDLLSAKKMVLIDTAGMAQRDARTRELLEMLSHRSIHKLLVVNAAAQGETIEDVVIAWRASLAAGVIVSKMDEAVKLGPCLDVLIRHKLKVLGVANGQRVPEDWHRLSSHALVHRSLRANAATAYRMDSSDVNLVFAGLHTVAGQRRAAASSALNA
ncbi:flagellar biosynthesis protein FlhF [Ideonella sp. BN130291]|uniref:flagellar biosynthesis protein FlhF n=1 Tax=Ideonella sp. BN130291 TaxID=3112940 RepID=UPI002E25B822|nr:flagellar biosynthesis protein FlhF [Ideonella sp. BN130291]